jgi:hypothetical protein
VLSRVSSSVIVVRMDPVEPESNGRAGAGRGRRGGGPVAAPAAASVSPPRLVPGVRVRSDLALIAFPGGMRVSAAPGLDMPIDLVATDEERRLAIVRTTGRTGPDALAGSLQAFGGFAFVALVDATPTGPTIEPLFIGRADPLIDMRWPQALTSMSVRQPPPEGGLLFSTGGRFIGLVTGTDTGPAVIPAPAIQDVVTRLLSNQSARP